MCYNAHKPYWYLPSVSINSSLYKHFRYAEFGKNYQSEAIQLIA